MQNLLYNKLYVVLWATKLSKYSNTLFLKLSIIHIFKLFEDDDKKITFRGTHIKSIAKPIQPVYTHKIRHGKEIRYRCTLTDFVHLSHRDRF